MHRSYVPKEWIDSFIDNDRHPLPFEAKERFFSVLRIKSDEKVAVFDGGGREVIGSLSRQLLTQEAFFSNAVLQIAKPLKPELVLIQAAIIEAKLTETIKRGCEYGIDRFVIFNALRSERFCFKKLQSKVSRLIHVAQDACRQSQRLFIPTIDFFDSLAQAIGAESASTFLGIFGDVEEKRLLSKLLLEHPFGGQAFLVVVGPEGGLSPDECEILRRSGFLGVRWSPNILRSELASLAPIAIFNAFCGRA